jgi:FkbH-like protein
MLLVSDFNVQILGRYISKLPSFERYAPMSAPFGQVYQALAARPSNDTVAAVVWTTPAGAVPSFAAAADFESIDPQQCLSEVDAFADQIARLAGDLRFVFVATWALPANQRGYGMLDWHGQMGLAKLLARMNVRLSDRLEAAKNVFVLDASRWLQSDGGVPTSDRMWYAAKVPYRNGVFERAARDLSAGIQAIEGRSRKLVVVDLDDTLWGNVVGETGWQGIRLGGIDHVGEAFRDFQKALRALSRRGIQLAIVSKNDEAVALQAIDEHPEMLLRRKDFVGWRINWNDKAANLRSLVEELNLGMSAVVFIDDNPAERERIRMAYPDVFVPDWPADPCAFVSTLQAFDCFESAGITDEDRKRTSMYVAERERRAVRDEVASLPDWLDRLQTRLRIEPVGDGQIARVAQLYNKTNQLNLSTRRMTGKEILAWAAEPGRAVLCVSVSDRFGDLGLSGVIGVEAHGSAGRLVDFVLSCRAMGRRVEEAMLHVAAAQLQRLGAGTMELTYLPTERNRPTLDVLAASQLAASEAHSFRYDITDGYPAPGEIAIEFVERN